MPYRSREDARTEERRALVEEIERLDAERARYQSNLRRRNELAARLRELDSPIAAPPKRRSIFEDLKLATPCSARWEEMIGDHRVRFCPSCAKNVYDVSSLTENEVEALIAETEGKFCGRLRERRDGTVLTEDCPVGVRRKRRIWFAVTAAAAAGAAAGATLAVHSEPRRTVHLVVMHGDPVSTKIHESDSPASNASEAAPPPPRYRLPRRWDYRLGGVTSGRGRNPR